MEERGDTVELSRGRDLSGLQRLLYAAGNFGVAFSPTVVAAWLGFFYYGREGPGGEPIVYVSAGAFGLIWFGCNAVNGLTDPVVGYLSDRTRSRWGRRKPWVVAGAPLLALSFFFLWTPVTEGPSAANALVLAAALFFFWFFFTVVVAPYLSLLPEITPYDDERVRVSAYMAIFEVLGTIGGNLLPPLFAALLAGGLWFLPDSYQFMALLAGLLLVWFFVQAVAAVRERYAPASDRAGSAWKGLLRALAEFGSTFRNRPFVPYVIGVGFYRMAISTVVFIAPFVATRVLAAYPVSDVDRSLLDALGAVADDGQVNWELAAGYLMMLVLVGAALFFPLVSWLAARWGKRRLFVIALAAFGAVCCLMAGLGELPAISPVVQALALFLLAAFPVSIALVVMRPLLADVIDADEKLTGKRREGVYNGMEGLIMKVAAGLGPLLAGALFVAFGKSTAHNLGVRLCGPLAGVCLLAAAAAFTRYPIRK
ncbi:MAG: MFS transporter [Deltaproteobacteria bacterium]|nr:MFS transporter [Deltaproteobacteria bacterium]